MSWIVISRIVGSALSSSLVNRCYVRWTALLPVKSLRPYTWLYFSHHAFLVSCWSQILQVLRSHLGYYSNSVVLQALRWCGLVAQG